MQQLYLDKVSGLIDATQFSEMNRAFGEEIKSAENRIRGLEAELEQQPEETDAAPAQRQRVRELAQVSHLTRELAVLLVRRVIVGTKDPLTGQQEITIEWAFSARKHPVCPLGYFRPPMWGRPHWKQR